MDNIALLVLHIVTCVRVGLSALFVQEDIIFRKGIINATILARPGPFKMVNIAMIVLLIALFAAMPILVPHA